MFIEIIIYDGQTYSMILEKNYVNLNHVIYAEKKSVKIIENCEKTNDNPYGTIFTRSVAYVLYLTGDKQITVIGTPSFIGAILK